MRIQKIYASLLAADLAASERWYTKLLGRGPDHRPMDSLIHWELFDQAGLMLSSSEEIATSVYNQAGEKLGSIYNFMVDKRTGKAARRPPRTRSATSEA